MPRPDDYARAIKTALNAANVPCEIGDVPDGRGWPGAVTFSGTFAPYVILHLDSGTAMPLSLGQPDDRIDFLFQITAAGETQEQAVQFAGRAREVLLPLAISVNGAAVHKVRQVAAQMPVRDDDTTPSTWIATAQYRFMTSPV